MIKGIERVAPMIHFQFEGVEVKLHGAATGDAAKK